MTVTPAPTIDALPTAPSRSDPAATFVSRADAFTAALPGMVTQINAATTATQANAQAAESAADIAVAAETAAEAAVMATTYAATSASSLSLTAGAKAVTLVESGRTFANGDLVTMIRRSDPTKRMRNGVVSAADMTAKTMTVTFASSDVLGSGGPYTDWLVILSALSADIAVGRHAFWFPTSGMQARTTNGAAVGITESTTNKVMQRTLDFDASTIEYAQFLVRMPKSWNEGTVSAVFVWLHGSTTTNFKVSWGLQAVALSDGDTLDAAFGTAQFANDTGGTTGTLYHSPETAAITIAGSPAAEDLVVFQVFRKADDATNDTLAVDAKLLGVTLYITTDVGTDA